MTENKNKTAIEILKQQLEKKKLSLYKIDGNLSKLKDEEEHILKCYNLDMARIHKVREENQTARQRFYNECADLESTIQTLEVVNEANTKLFKGETKNEHNPTSEEIYNRHTCIGSNCKHRCHFPSKR